MLLRANRMVAMGIAGMEVVEFPIFRSEEGNENEKMVKQASKKP